MKMWNLRDFGNLLKCGFGRRFVRESSDNARGLFRGQQGPGKSWPLSIVLRPCQIRCSENMMFSPRAMGGNLLRRVLGPPELYSGLLNAGFECMLCRLFLGIVGTVQIRQLRKSAGYLACFSQESIASSGRRHWFYPCRLYAARALSTACRPDCLKKTRQRRHHSRSGL